MWIKILMGKTGELKVYTEQSPPYVLVAGCRVSESSPPLETHPTLKPPCRPAISVIGELE